MGVVYSSSSGFESCGFGCRAEVLRYLVRHCTGSWVGRDWAVGGLTLFGLEGSRNEDFRWVSLKGVG